MVSDYLSVRVSDIRIRRNFRDSFGLSRIYEISEHLSFCLPRISTSCVTMWAQVQVGI
jgi:hypothetical protein